MPTRADAGGGRGDACHAGGGRRLSRERLRSSHATTHEVPRARVQARPVAAPAVRRPVAAPAALSAAHLTPRRARHAPARPRGAVQPAWPRYLSRHGKAAHYARGGAAPAAHRRRARARCRRRVSRQSFGAALSCMRAWTGPLRREHAPTRARPGLDHDSIHWACTKPPTVPAPRADAAAAAALNVWGSFGPASSLRRWRRLHCGGCSAPANWPAERVRAARCGRRQCISGGRCGKRISHGGMVAARSRGRERSGSAPQSRNLVGRAACAKACRRLW